LATIIAAIVADEFCNPCQKRSNNRLHRYTLPSVA